MIDIDRRDDFACDDARKAIQERLDDPLPAPAEAALHRHLASCSSCRAYRQALLQVRESMRNLPPVALPDEALATVWAQTAGPERPRAAIHRWFASWRPLAAAAVLAFALISGRMAIRRAPTELPREVPQTTVNPQLLADARLALELTGYALRRVERTTVEDVLAERVSPALNSVPIKLP